MSTGIQWTDETWNPVVGCNKVSPGCKRCYAKELHDKRHKAHLAGKKVAPQYAQPFEHVQLMPDRLVEPLSWRKPRRVFVNSVSDLFHEDVPDDFLDRVFAVMALADWHTFQVLTKRPARMLQYMTERWKPATNPPQSMGDDRHSRVCIAIEGFVYSGPTMARFGGERWWTEDGKLRARQSWPLPNVWLGVSVENQKYADERIPLLLETPAAMRFLSCEPLLSPVDLTRLRPAGATWVDGLEGREHVGPAVVSGDPRIDWVIVGGESGKGARVCDVEWIADLLAQCDFAGVPCFVKQLGRSPVRRVDGVVTWPEVELRDRKGGDMDEWPAELRVRQFPGHVFPEPTVPA